MKSENGKVYSKEYTYFPNVISEILTHLIDLDDYLLLIKIL